jgi:hypothetical protein
MNILAIVIMLTWGETWIVTETIIPQSIGILATLIVLVLFIVLGAYYYLGTLVYWFWGLIVTSKGAVYYLPNPVNIVTN